MFLKQYEVVLLGENNVGKTEILSKLQFGKSSPENDMQLSNQFIRYTVKNIFDEKSLSFNIWDTPGDHFYIFALNRNIKNADVVILMYDVTNEKSFIELKEFWYKLAKDYAKKNAIYAVVANKSEFDPKVSNNDGEEFAKSIGAIFANTQIRNEKYTKNLFELIAYKIINPNFNLEK